MEKNFLVVLCLIIGTLRVVNAQVPAVFIFGDSTADVGTNSFLPGSKARADFPHNGIDFPHSRPTGRFSNGLNSADFIAKLMGFKRSPLPFLALANNTKFLKRPSFRGANFASGGSGILDITGQTRLTLMKFEREDSLRGLQDSQKNVVPLKEQIEQFSSVFSNLITIKGPADAASFMSRSLFFISIGSNDIFAYKQSRSNIPKQQFVSTLAAAYENHLRNLLKLGARKIGIISVPPIGCCPSQRVYNVTGGCLEDLNEIAREFHSTLDALMIKLSSEYLDLKYSLGNAYEMTVNVINNPIPFGFKEVQSACCGVGRLNAESFCDVNANLCSVRHEYLFWDLFHPTMAASKLAAFTLYNGEPRFVAPINFKQLAEAY